MSTMLKVSSNQILCEYITKIVCEPCYVLVKYKRYLKVYKHSIINIQYNMQYKHIKAFYIMKMWPNV